jgi:hypothetical protein
MTERTIRIVQRCTSEEAAAMVAAIRAFEAQRCGPERPPARAAPAAAPTAPSAPGHPGKGLRKDGTGVQWTRSETSLGRGF